MSRAATTVRFYNCAPPSYDEALRDCDRPLRDWLLSLSPAPAGWTPQAKEIDRIDQDVASAQASAVASCEASKLASHQAPEPGIHLSVVSKSNAAMPEGDGASGLRAAVPVSFSPQTECGKIKYHVLHKPATGGSHDLSGTKFTPKATPPTKNGVGKFADSIIFDLTDASTEWRKHIHKIFTRGNWRIDNTRVLNHYANWSEAGEPKPSKELLDRSDEFDISRLKFDLPDFPQLYPDDTGPRWLVVHRYTHRESGKAFYFSEWMGPTKIINGSWPQRGLFGHGFSGEVAQDIFEAPTDGDTNFFDPEGTWIHQSGVMDFAMNNILVHTKYSNDLCDESWRTITPAGMIDPLLSGFVGPSAYFEEEVKVRTIRQYKACYRVVSVAGIACIGYVVKVKLKNEFSFPACVVVRLPLGYGAKTPDNQTLSQVTVVVARNLAANSESGEISVVVPTIFAWDLASTNYTIQSVIDDATSNFDGAIVDHGFVCEQNQYADGAYITTIKNTAGALPATASQKAVAYGFYGADGARHWTSGTETGSQLSDIVFSYSMPALSLGPAETGGFFISVRLHYSLQDFEGNWHNYTYDFGSSLTVAEAIQRYGRVITVSASNASRHHGTSGQQGGAIFTQWSGGNSSELEAHLLSKLQTQLQGNPYWANILQIAGNIVWEVLSHPAVVFSNAGPHYASKDYPGGIGTLPPANGDYFGAAGSFGLFVEDSYSENSISLVAI